MEDIEHVRIYLLEQYADYSKDIPEISVEEQTGNQDEKDSTHKGRNVLIKDRDPKGINCFLKAGPVALLPGLLFFILSFLHIWLIIPTVQLLLMNMHRVNVVWASVLDLTISPFFFSLGRCFESISIHCTKD
ncbi:caveolin-2-like [Ictalurus punctatus]|uniref:Caveolin n=1 Tax=Ictalurus punctatus TaxID=7998 RepID=A0A9F7RMN2_ICTPU|nr:caveolin-2-like [Ictalurus punctatus]